ncbi:sequence-specific DNA binding transcription factor [Parasponia andersonii]|uniref:Sequence-specific DNA binding transcription factor n=1 Tax=Parasponia andersonii TaxID=3476 RepID=A0A2P5B2U5_PARAD|nr:sequence-specific DNA binding transcription factor [Parasponia andersonii]
MDSDAETPSPAATRRTRTTPFSGSGGREDCWSEEATSTLVEAWGDRYLALKRGNLRQQHWQEVADAVNSDHGDGGVRSRRTDIQCKNRIDTLKKKYKIEKARVFESEGSYVSAWPFFARLDALIGKKYPMSKVFSPPAVAGVNRNPSPPSWARYSPVPVGPRSATQKRPAPSPATAPLGGDYSGSQRNFSVFAEAAVAALEEEEVDNEDTDRSGSRSSTGSRRRNREGEPLYRGLAKAIERFGEIYERVEAAKQRQMVELEKQRMQFAKDLEFQRMQLFMETQVQLQKIKRAKRSSGNGESLVLFFPLFYSVGVLELFHCLVFGHAGNTIVSQLGHL